MTRILLAALTLVCSSVATARQDDSRPYLDAARDVARWLDQVSVTTEHGLVWHVEPAAAVPIVRFDLYSGTPGVILFLLELHHATGDPEPLRHAQAGADALIANLDAALESGEVQLNPALWTGLAGQAWTLDQVGRATGDDRYRQAAGRLTLNLIARAKAVTGREGVAWNDTTDIIAGSAGIILFLLYADREMGVDGALTAALHAGDRLIELAEPAPGRNGPDAGLRWRMDPDFARIMPNYSHGTAGISDALLRISLHLRPDGRPAEDADPYHAAAVRGADHLAHLAAEHDGLIHHHTPGGEDLLYLGWCHGPVGTSILTDNLGQADRATHTLRRLIELGLPDTATDGYWNNVGQCCGTAGIGAFAIDQLGGEHDDVIREFINACGRHILERSTNDDDGRRWPQAEHRVRPDLLQTQTGFMQGAAGVGLFLLQLDALTSDRTPLIGSVRDIP